MFGSTTIEIVIGIIVVFILISTICTAIREGIESMLKTRAAYLEQGIRQLLDDKDGDGLSKAFYSHPLISNLFDGEYKAGKYKSNSHVFARGGDLPSYIPSKNFARALMDMAVAGAGDNALTPDDTSPVISLSNIRRNVASIGTPKVQRALLNAVDMAQGDLNKAQENIENWFNSTMDRVSGWYKRSTQWIIFGISLTVSIGMNVDTIKIINYLSENDTARKMMVSQAEAIKDKDITYKEAQAYLESSELPIGWENTDFPDGFALAMTLFGWLITALAATLGAPYWFDMLNKVMVVRATVKPHEKSPEEASQDAQPAVQPESTSSVHPAYAGMSSHVHHQADNCSMSFGHPTPDEELPESKGGTES